MNARYTILRFREKDREREITREGDDAEGEKRREGREMLMAHGGSITAPG